MEYRNNSINREDIYNLRLINIQQLAVIIGGFSDIISYYAVLLGKELIANNYIDNETEVAVRSDETSLTALYLYLIAKLLFTGVGFNRYNYLYEKKINGEFEYSLEPNMDINIGNIFGLIGLLFLIRGAEGIYTRDNNQPIFGAR